MDKKKGEKISKLVSNLRAKANSKKWRHLHKQHDSTQLQAIYYMYLSWIFHSNIFYSFWDLLCTKISRKNTKSAVNQNRKWRLQNYDHWDSSLKKWTKMVNFFLRNRKHKICGEKRKKNSTKTVNLKWKMWKIVEIIQNKNYYREL